jgi:hypothetical protein
MTTILKDKKFFYGDSNYKNNNIPLTDDEANDIKQSIQELQAEREQAGKDFFKSIGVDIE